MRDDLVGNVLIYDHDGNFEFYTRDRRLADVEAELTGVIGECLIGGKHSYTTGEEVAEKISAIVDKTTGKSLYEIVTGGNVPPVDEITEVYGFKDCGSFWMHRDVTESYKSQRKLGD
ncbi:MAG: hypothetical protein LBT09_06655 [Planctomycetaceae bacterium]|jgi:hypothetical protein|nr:hypothetical protein [Planctomycetaceae bacterium]